MKLKNSIWNSIRTKFLLVFSITAVPLLLVLLILENSYHNAFQDTAAIHAHQDRQTSDISKLQLNLVEQIRDWKNLLLRGQVLSLYHKHLALFYSHERAVFPLIRNLRETSATDPAFLISLKEFSDIHRNLGKAQRKAIRTYNSPIENAANLADESVSGIEEQVISQLANLSRLTEERMVREIIAIESSLNDTKSTVLTISFLILFGSSIVLWRVASKGIVEPIQLAVRSSLAIASGKLQQPITSNYPGEMGVLLAAQEEMRQNLLKAIDQRKQILNAAGEGIYGVDLDGLCTFVNPAAEVSLGWQADEIQGKNLHELLSHTKPDGSHYLASQSPIFSTFTDGEVHTVVDEIFWRKDGSQFPVEYTTTPIFENGEATGAVVVFHDISERKELQSQLIQSSKMATLGEMATGIAHELNQPLNVIRMAINNIKRKSAENKADHTYLSEKLDKVERQIERASAITDHMRIFGRKANAEPQSIDPAKMVLGTLEMISDQLRLSNIIVKVDVPTGFRISGSGRTGHT